MSWLWDEFEDARIEVHELVDAGDQVLASVTLQGRGRQSGADVAWDLWHLWWIKGGKAVRGQAFRDKEQALEAAGLSE